MFRAPLETCALFKPLFCDTLLCITKEELFQRLDLALLRPPRIVSASDGLRAAVESALPDLDLVQVRCCTDPDEPGNHPQ